MEIREDLPTSTIRERLIYEACSSDSGHEDPGPELSGAIKITALN
jgi:hypothetical protein